MERQGLYRERLLSLPRDEGSLARVERVIKAATTRMRVTIVGWGTGRGDLRDKVSVGPLAASATAVTPAMILYLLLALQSDRNPLADGQSSDFSLDRKRGFTMERFDRHYQRASGGSPSGKTEDNWPSPRLR